LRTELQEIFKLTPKSKRAEQVGFTGRFMMGKSGLYRLRWNYVYIGILAFRSTLLASAIIGALSLCLTLFITQILDIDINKVNLNEDSGLATQVGFVGLYAYLHAKSMTYAIWCVALMGFLLFLIHVPKGSEDVFAGEVVLRHKEKRTLPNKIKRGVLFFVCGGIFGYLASNHSYIALSFVVRFLPEDSIGGSLPFIAFYYIFSLAAHASGAAAIYISTVMIHGLLAGYDRYWGINEMQ